MSKDQFWFKHDAGAQDDPKCMQLIEDLGMEGYGIYWALIEKLRSEANYSLPISAYKPLARRMNTSDKKVQSVVECFGLFEIRGDRFFSPALCKRMEYNTSRARAAAEKRWHKTLEISVGSHASALQEHTECIPLESVEQCSNMPIRREDNRVEHTKNILPPKSAKAFSEDSEKFAEWYLKDFAPDSIKKSLTPRSKSKWMETYDFLIRHGYTKDQIVAAVRWARSDSFWSSNFQSPVKLRDINKQGVRYIDVFLERIAAHAGPIAVKSANAKAEYDRIKAVGFKSCSQQEVDWAYDYQHREEDRFYREFPPEERLPKRGSRITYEEAIKG